MNELREEMAMCAHMRVNQKNVLLDGTESGRISDSWVCGDCGTLFIPEAANREQKAEIERLTALNKQLHEANFRQAAKINSIVGARAEFADTLLKLFGYTMYTEEYENASIVDEVKAAIVRADKAEAELASLRASVGEKPEDAWIRASESLRKMAAYCFNEWGMTEAASRVMNIKNYAYVAPTLPGEEK